MIQQEIEIISDTLCSIYDWDSLDLKSDFMNAVKQNNINLSDKIIEKIFDNFMNLDALTRCSPEFNYQEFISNHCIS